MPHHRQLVRSDVQPQHQTTFPLTGAHISVPCATCHVNNVFAGLSTACISCHLKDWQGTTNPNHAAAAFPQTCAICHTTTNWPGATFDHNTQTKFPLTGAHVNVACSHLPREQRTTRASPRPASPAT